MNRYSVRIPYDYPQYGTLTCEVYAESEEEAEELASDCDSRHNEDYNDSDGGDMEFNYDSIEVELEDEDVEPPENPYSQRPQSKESSHLQLTAGFISDLVLV